MDLSTIQKQALLKVENWLKNSDKQIFRLFGYAGTGKTTLARHFSSTVKGKVLFAAYTGKAAHVLRTKGCTGADTIHSLIYNPKGVSKNLIRNLEKEFKKEKDAKKKKELKEKIEKQKKLLERPFFTLNTDSEVQFAKLVIIDECSMVDDKMAEDLLSFGTKILVLGDPAQLPPVKGTGYFTENVEPDVMLTGIHRQAENNPIINLATQVRNNKDLSVGRYGTSMVETQQNKEYIKAQVLLNEQVIVGTNKTRTFFNNKIREMLGRKDKNPQIGDKVVCLKNNKELGILNGTLWVIEEIIESDPHKTKMLVKSLDDNKIVEVECHTRIFLGQEKSIPWYEKNELEQFDYGYALTCHKSQGSQWDSVLVYDESSCFKASANRWLYTAITRAAKNVVVIQ